MTPNLTRLGSYKKEVPKERLLFSWDGGGCRPVCCYYLLTAKEC